MAQQVKATLEPTRNHRLHTGDAPGQDDNTSSLKDIAEPANYGGQAVIEGVMMRSRERVAVAVRRPDGGIEVQCEPLNSLYRSKWARAPLIRGCLTLWDALALGMRALMFSAEVAAGEEASISGPIMWGTVAFSLALGVGLFFALPALAASLLDRWLSSAWMSNLVEGVVRLVLFLGYLVAITLIPDIRRVFAYHGAEHKVINTHEANEPLTLERARLHSTAHARCGTGFLLIVVIVSVLVFGFVGRPHILIRLASRVVLIPAIAAISYEIVHLASRHRDSRLAKAILWPSVLLQRLTTREPSDDMIEVALVALRHILDQKTCAASDLAKPSSTAPT